jgi:hypothetical protein
MNGDKHYNLTVTDDNGKALTTTNVSTKHPDEIVRLMTLAGLAQAQAAQATQPQAEPESDCGCGGTVEIVDSVDEAEYEPTGPQDLDLDDFSKKTADSISRQKKFIQPSRGDNPLMYSSDEDDIYESLLAEFGKLEEAKNAYAVGMAAAEKETGDKPPLKKSTIKKAHADAAEKRKKMGPVTSKTLADINDKLGNTKKSRYVPPAERKAALNNAGFYYSGDKNSEGWNEFSNTNGQAYWIGLGRDGWKNTNGESGSNNDDSILKSLARIGNDKKKTEEVMGEGVDQEPMSSENYVLASPAGSSYVWLWKNVDGKATPVNQHLTTAEGGKLMRDHGIKWIRYGAQKYFDDLKNVNETWHSNMDKASKKAHKIAKAVQKNESTQKKSKKIDEARKVSKIAQVLNAYNATIERKNWVDYNPPGLGSWTRGDGSRYRDPGNVVAYFNPNDKEPVALFLDWLKNYPKTKSIGGVKDWYGSSKPREAYTLNGILFTISDIGRVQYGSTSRLRNSNVWSKTEAPVAEAPILGPKGDIHRAASADQSDREYIEQRQFKDKWKHENPGITWPGYDKAGFKSRYYKTESAQKKTLK